MSFEQAIDLISSDEENQIVEILSSSSPPITYLPPKSIVQTTDFSKSSKTQEDSDSSSPPPCSPKLSFYPLVEPPDHFSSPKQKHTEKSPDSIKSPKTVEPMSPKRKVHCEENPSCDAKLATSQSSPIHNTSQSSDFFKAVPIKPQLSDSEEDDLPPLVIPSKTILSDDDLGSSLSCDEDFDLERKNVPLQNSLQRKRSCSITPPPEFSPVYKSTKLTKLRPVSPDSLDVTALLDPSKDQTLNFLDFDPEFQAIMKNKQSSSLSTNNESIDNSTSQVKCKIRCNFPKVQGFESNIPQFYKPIEFFTKLNDTLEQMFQYIWTAKKIPEELLIVEYKGVKLYKNSTPAKLGIHATSNAVFDVFTIDAYHLLLEKRKLAEIERLMDDKPEELSSPEPEQESIEPSLISISVRLPKSKNNIEVFKLKGSTTISKILESLRTKMDLPLTANLRLVFDGESLDPESTVQDAELDDEDMIDLHLS